MPNVKVLMIPITGPGDVLKLQDILEQVLKEDGVKDLHGIGCACGSDNCDKRLDVHRMQDGKVGLIIAKGANIVAGIVLDEAGAKELAAQLTGA